MNEFIDQFHFLRPWWFVALLACAAIFVMLLRNFQRNTQWQNLIDARLLPYLLDGAFSKTKKIPLYGVLGLWALTVLALAGPTWEKKPQPLQREDSAMIILWDLSPSMFAEDIKPSRVVRARLKLVDLLDARQEGLTALIAYAGDAHVVTPLTDDTRTIKSLLPGLAPSVMPAAGSQPESALELALALFKDTGVSRGDVVFLTDDIASSAVPRLTALAASYNIRVTVWGIGTSEGAPIPLPGGGFAKNNRGEIVVPKLDHDGLSVAAMAMSGVYIPFANDNRDIESILHFGLRRIGKADQDKTRLLEQWREQGHWLLLLLLPFAALTFRRGWILCFAFILPYSPPSQALDWKDLWQNRDQQALKLLEEDPDAAAALFENQDWRAVANYQAGDFPSAESHFTKGTNATAYYNLGNAFTQQGRYDEAVAAYDKALELKPEMQVASENRAIAEQLKKLDDSEHSESGDQGQENENQEGEGGEEKGDEKGRSQEGQEGQEGEQQQSEDQQQGENSQQQPSEPSQEEEPSQQQSADQQAQQSSEQQQALEDFYQQQPEASNEQEQQDQAQQLTKEQEDAEQAELSEQQQRMQTMMNMSPEEKEKQQALEQWLRKVPDDPSGLLRNKFNYEYQKRRREQIQQSFRTPNGNQQEERW